MVLAQIVIPYKRYITYLKYACLSLLAYVVIAVLPKVHVDWSAVIHNLLFPQWSAQPAYILTIVGFLGTTISPYLFFWQAGEQVEDDIAEGLTNDAGYRKSRIKRSEIRAVRADTATGMIFSQIITVFIIVGTAGNAARFRQNRYQHRGRRRPRAFAARGVGILAVYAGHPGRRLGWQCPPWPAQPRTPWRKPRDGDMVSTGD